MAIQSPMDLFLYDLSGMHDSQKKSTQWKGDMVNQVRDANLQQVIRKEQQQGQQMVKNLDACFQALGTKPRDVPCLATDGMRAEYQQFMTQNPSPETMEMYSVGMLLNAAHYDVGAHKNLVDKAMLLGQTQCAQILQTNLVMAEETAGRVERCGHEMSQRVMATA